jgi:hypothetical protein
MRDRRLVVALALTTAVLAGCGSGGGGGSKVASAASTTVEDHVHGVVPGPHGSQIIIATHYGLETSSDGGATWQPNTTLGREMVSGIVRARGQYVASLERMPGMSMPAMKSSMRSMPGMSMSATTTSDLGYSTNTASWHAAQGIPAKATITALTAGPDGTAWASVLGSGIFESTDGGRDWRLALPDRVPVTALATAGQSLAFATPSGVFVTDAGSPSVPALAQLNSPVNDLVSWEACPLCLVAATPRGGVAVSRNAGVTWKQQAPGPVFDEVQPLTGSAHALLGMVASGVDPKRGVWRSGNGGKSWTRVLDRPLVDHVYQVPASPGHPGSLLAFQWGIKVFRSTDGGRQWTRIAHIAAP